jgi:hypothetical protein
MFPETPSIPRHPLHVQPVLVRGRERRAQQGPFADANGMLEVSLPLMPFESVVGSVVFATLCQVSGARTRPQGDAHRWPHGRGRHRLIAAAHTRGAHGDADRGERGVLSAPHQRSSRLRQCSARALRCPYPAGAGRSLGGCPSCPQHPIRRCARDRPPHAQPPIPLGHT